MNNELLISFFGWGAVINYLVLLLVFLFFVVARDSWLNLLGKWFTLSQQSFDKIHYALLGLFEVVVFIFFVTPYLVLRFFA